MDVTHLDLIVLTTSIVTSSSFAVTTSFLPTRPEGREGMWSFRKETADDWERKRGGEEEEEEGGEEGEVTKTCLFPRQRMRRQDRRVDEGGRRTPFTGMGGVSRTRASAKEHMSIVIKRQGDEEDDEPSILEELPPSSIRTEEEEEKSVSSMSERGAKEEEASFLSSSGG